MQMIILLDYIVTAIKFALNAFLTNSYHITSVLAVFSVIPIAIVISERPISMKVAIPVYGDYASSVFDFAHKLLLVDIENGHDLNRSEVTLIPESVPQRAARLKSLGVDLLICGAISQPLMYMLTGSGIKVLPYVTGRVDELLQAYMTGQLSQQQFILPGFWSGARKGFGHWRRGCRWRGGQK
jgi:predicted Fe-Mo cluster-binding NifX family protein